MEIRPPHFRDLPPQRRAAFRRPLLGLHGGFVAGDCWHRAGCKPVAEIGINRSVNALIVVTFPGLSRRWSIWLLKLFFVFITIRSGFRVPAGHSGDSRAPEPPTLAGAPEAASYLGGGPGRVDPPLIGAGHGLRV